jgi:molybdopterin/thiamine biosynthesis adenylyltransferase
LDETNRNRFVGARFDDEVPGTAKVDIIARQVREIDPDIQVRPLKRELLSEEAFQAVRDADWAFGCFDEDGPRLILNELCIAYNKPYIDLASDVPEAGIYGGRITLSKRGTGCLKCHGLLDPRDLRRFFATDGQLEADDRIYGVDRKMLEVRGPSVSPINGVVAALAATEFMVAVTGLREPVTNIDYRGHQAKVVVVNDAPAPDCPVCATRGQGAVAEVERYLALSHVIERRAKKTGHG